MERGEDHDILSYKKFSEAFPVAKEIARDEEEHEKELTNLINEESLKYVSSIVLGLNDALIELTGALAGFTLAFVKVNYIVIAALITGISAALSMAVSEYLSTKMGEEHKSPLKASFYTGIPYILTVIILILPFLIIKNVYFALGFTVFNAILLIFLFNFYISVAKDINFKERFFEMVFLTLGVVVVNFLIGFAVIKFLGLEI